MGDAPGQYDCELTEVKNNKGHLHSTLPMQIISALHIQIHLVLTITL